MPLCLLIAGLLLVSCASDPPQPAESTAAPARTIPPSPTSTAMATVPPTSTPTVPPTSTPPPTLTPEPTPSYPVLTLEPEDRMMQVYPGPPHYQGDVLIFEINAGRRVEEGEAEVTLQLDGGYLYEVQGEWDRQFLRFPFDTEELIGEHRLEINARQNYVNINRSYSFEILPASQRPAQEEDAAWVSRELECCTLHYITDTAAARDIEPLSRTVREAVDGFQSDLQVEVQDRLDIYFIDRMWFNGAFGGPGELLIVYTDRFYGPTLGLEGVKTLVRHELGHAVFSHFSFNEGLCVYAAGGHYTPHPIPQRAAAMLELGYYDPERGTPRRHETKYLYQAGVVNYIIEAYGWEGLRAFMEADNADGDAFSEAARDKLFNQTLGLSREAFYEDYVDWLRSQDPGEQLEDLELTVELQELRREYQDRYERWPWMLFGWAEETFARPEYLRVNIREPRTPAHIATELLIADAQRALMDDRYQEVEKLIPVIEDIVDTGRLAHPLAREYGNVVYALAEEGYETVGLELHGARAEATVTASPPELEAVTLRKENGRWLLDRPR